MDSWVLRKGNFIISLISEEVKSCLQFRTELFWKHWLLLEKPVCLQKRMELKQPREEPRAPYLHNSCTLISFLICPAYRSWCNCPEIHYRCNWNLLQNWAFLTECLLGVTVKFQNFTSEFYCLSCKINKMLKNWLSPQVYCFCNDSNDYHITEHLLICLHRHENLQ